MFNSVNSQRCRLRATLSYKPFLVPIRLTPLCYMRKTSASYIKDISAMQALYFPTINKLKAHWQTLFPGVVVCIIVAVTAHFLSEHYATPVMLLALLLGIAASFLSEEGRTVAGVNFSATSLLRLVWHYLAHAFLQRLFPA